MPSTPEPSRLAPHHHGHGLLLLLVVVVIWGVVWPVNKAILDSMTPLWMVSVRSIIAGVVLFPLMAALGRLRLPRRADMPILLSITLLHMVGFATLTGMGLQLVPAGRSVVLGYTVSLWVMPGAVLLLGERFTARRATGVVIGLLGLLVLFNPLSFDWSDRDAVLGNLFILGGAVLWAANILHMRGHRWQSTPFDLLPWETLLAGVILITAAVIVDGVPQIQWDGKLIGLLLFSGPFAGALAFWAMAAAARSLPAVTTALGLLGVPVVGIVVAALALAEPITLSLLAGVGLILGGVAIGVTGSKPKAI